MIVGCVMVAGAFVCTSRQNSGMYTQLKSWSFGLWRERKVHVHVYTCVLLSSDVKYTCMLIV